MQTNLPLLTPTYTLGDLYSRGTLYTISTASGWTETKVQTGGNASAQGPNQQKTNTGTTALSSDLFTVASFGLDANGTMGAFRVNWAKRIYLGFRVSRLNSDTECTVYVQLKEVNTIGQLGEKGIGLVIANYAMTIESYGTQRGTVDLSTSLTDNRSAKIVLIHDPVAVTLSCYVSGILKGTQSTAANLPATASADAYFAHSIANGATGTVNAINRITNLWCWIET